MDFFEGGQELGAGCLLQEVTGGASGERIIDVIGIFVHREHDELGSGEDRFELADGLDTTDAREIDVHEDDIGLQELEFGEGGFGRTPLTGEAEAGCAHNPAGQDFARLGVVLDEGNGDGHGIVIVDFSGKGSHVF